ncbi:MarR family transcriptional regulator [Latilactobacillus curvatus]|nr:MarR family transcriptional regulator [Latilactobacillus curvatus]
MTGGFDVLINNQSELSRWYIDYREVSAQLSRICRGYGLGLDELLFLEQLTINGTQLPGQLAETFKMSHPGITRKLNLLQERNLVKKIRGERQDLRLVDIAITADGQKIYEQIIAEVTADKLDERMLTNLTSVNQVD